MSTFTYLSKKLLSIVSPAFGLLLCWGQISAQTTTAGQFSFEIDKSKGVAIVTGLKSTSSKIVDPTIPDEIEYDGDTYRVTEIKADAFANAYYSDYAGRMLSGQLTLPSTLEKIGKNAFKECTNLTGGLTIPNSVTTIEATAFENCTGLTGPLVLSESLVSIGSSAFHKCTSLTGSLDIPNGIKAIETACFSECGFDGDLKLPVGLTQIGNSAFYGCKFTGHIEFPNSITEIGNYAFSYTTCANDTLTIPGSCTRIGTNAFEAAGSFTTLILPASLTYIDVYAFNGMTLNTVICKAVTPPGMGYNFAFTSETRKGTLKVPRESVDDYKVAYYDWQYWSNIEPIENEVTSICLNQTKVEMAVGKTFQLEAIVQPEDIESYTITWESSDNAVATVDNGLITAYATGSVTISATTSNGLTATCQINVWDLGDTNGDGKIDASDLVNINNYILGNPTMSFIASAADINNDGIIDQADVMMVAQLILSGKTKTNNISLPIGKLQINETSEADLDKITIRHYGQRAELYLSNEKYSAIQFDIHMPQGTAISEAKLGSAATETHILMSSPIESEENATRFLIFSTANNEFQSIEDPVMELTFDKPVNSNIPLEGILAVKTDGTSNSLGYANDWTAGVNEIGADTLSIEPSPDGVIIRNATGQQILIYNINGQSVFASIIKNEYESIDIPPGIYIISIGKKSMKFIVH